MDVSYVGTALSNNSNLGESPQPREATVFPVTTRRHLHCCYRTRPPLTRGSNKEAAINIHTNTDEEQYRRAPLTTDTIAEAL